MTYRFDSHPHDLTTIECPALIIISRAVTKLNVFLTNQPVIRNKQNSVLMFAEIPCNMHIHLNSFFLSVFNRAKDEAAPQILCPLCQMVDLAVETNKMCGDCGKNFCQKCGTFVPGEGRVSTSSHSSSLYVNITIYSLLFYKDEVNTII
ncbi:hypothetical protein AVEN_151922-1 [Araneus ventricosus]|uniref:Uncharacterized protein n=1 Tax=Araneus ventricosus TaxID=182803 RepID=A0A4Y2VV76_ARAVE|nr:hypothetical protein AVEN_151922-1 [Araneus ventricosus]